MSLSLGFGPWRKTDPGELALLLNAFPHHGDLENAKSGGSHRCSSLRIASKAVTLQGLVWCAFSVVVLLYASARAIQTIRSATTGASGSHAVVHELALLSAHVGPKFLGLQNFFVSNKLNFATTNNASLYLAEDMYANPDFKGMLPGQIFENGQLAQNQFQIKIEMALAVFAKYGHQTKWAVWVDGDTWLAERPVDLMSKLKLNEDNPVDLIIGSEIHGPNVSAKLTPCGGINTGVFAIRNSPSAIAFLHQLLAISPAEYAIVKDHFDDQCAMQELWRRDAAWLKSASVLASEDTSRLLQCRSRAKCVKYFPDLCCTADSWSVHWPASDWHDPVERLVEEETGTDVLTNIAHSIEVEACQAIEGLEGHPAAACRNIHAM